MIDRKLLALLFILVAVFASLEVRPRTLVLSIAMSEDSPSPLNKGPLGASALAEVLSGSGFKVIVAPSPSDLRLISPEDGRIVIFVLGSDYLSRESAARTAEAIRYLSKRVEWLGVIVADEAPSQASRLILEAAQNAVCGSKILSIGNTYAAPRVIAHFTFPSGSYLLETGYTAPVYFTKLSGPGFAVIPPGGPTPNPIPEPGVKSEMIGYAWPSTEPPRGLWYPIAGYCMSDSGAVVVVGDTSIFINRFMNSSEDAAKVAVELVRLASGGQDSLVVFVQEHYVSREALQSIAVRILPSIILIYIASVYNSIEPAILRAIATSGPLAAAFAASLAFIAWALLPLPQSKERVKSIEEPRRVSRVRVWLLKAKTLVRLSR